MGNTLKLPSPTKLARLGHFPPAIQAGRLAGPVFYVYAFSLVISVQRKITLIPGGPLAVGRPAALPCSFMPVSFKQAKSGSEGGRRGGGVEANHTGLTHPFVSFDAT